MAVLQISKIQVRRGQRIQLPTLSAGEFAWAIDSQELFIGNGAVSEGAPSVNNTRLLTELDASNIFKLAATYTYEGNTSATVITGADANSPVSRTLQDKLDDYVSLADFGAIGDGVADDTVSLQRAIDQIYLNSDKAEIGTHQNRKKLRFPAGTYKISNTLYVPSHATLEGDGMDRTVIKQSSTATAIFQTIDFGSTPTARVLYPSIQSTTQPKNIKVSGMTLQYDSSTKQGSAPLVLVDCAVDTQFEEIRFHGLATQPDADSQEAVNIRGQGSTTSDNITFNKCKFDNIAKSIISNYDVTNIKVTNSLFDTVVDGIVCGETLTNVNPQTVGPVGVQVKGNRFERVFRFAVYAGSNPYNISSQIVSEGNIYNDCGNGGSSSLDDDQQYSVLNFLNPDNKSINDKFSRVDTNNAGTPAVFLPEVLGHAYIQPNVANSLTLATLSYAVPIVKTAKLDGNDTQILINYVASQPTLGVTRTGQVQVLAGINTCTVYDSFQYAGAATLAGNIEFSASLNTSTNELAVNVLNPIGSVPTNLVYQYNKLF